MWVVPSFDGDVDMEVAKKQHAVYGPALWIIVRQCNLYAEFTRRVLDDADHLEWGTVESFDHRTLQGAHDLLAAVCRFRNDFRQSELPFPGSAPRFRLLDQPIALYAGVQNLTRTLYSHDREISSLQQAELHQDGGLIPIDGPAGVFEQDVAFSSTVFS